MELFLLVARLLLAAIFIIAGFSKLADLKGSRKTLTDFGLPTVFANPLGILLPLAELTIAGLLLPVASAWWGGLSALVLLLLFIVGIGINLTLGRTPDCHCFGQVHSKPVGWPTILRNAVFALMAGLIVWPGQAIPTLSLLKMITGLSAIQAAGLALLAIVTFEGWLLFNLIRQNGRLLLRLESLETRLNAAGIASASLPTPIQPGLAIGALAPPFQLPNLSAKKVTLDNLRAKGKPVFLVFSDPDCDPCDAMLPDLTRWQREQANKLTIALVSRGNAEANRAKAVAHGLKTVLLQNDREVAEQYQCPGTPGAVIVSSDGRIGSHLAMGAEAIRELMAQASGAPMSLPVIAGGNGHHRQALMPMQVGPKPGEVAPSFKLPNLTGKMVELADYKGRSTLVLFWNPTCGFCNQMLPELNAWESNRPKGAPELVLISMGTAESNQAINLQSTVLLDQRFGTGRAFGANGTPSAVLINAEGRIASEVAVGGPAVLALAGVGQNEKALSMA